MDYEEFKYLKFSSCNFNQIFVLREGLYSNPYVIKKLRLISNVNYVCHLVIVGKPLDHHHFIKQRKEDEIPNSQIL